MSGYRIAMGEKELRAKYGGKLDKAINRAIRAELPGGNEALDMLEKLSGPAFHAGAFDEADKPTPEAIAFQKHQRSVVNPMIAKIRQKYGVPPERSKTASRSPRPRGAGGKQIFKNKPSGGRKRPSR